MTLFTHIYAAPTPSARRARLPLIFVLVLLATIAMAVAVASRLLGLWGGAPLAAAPRDPDAVSVKYVTEGGEGVARGMVNSPLRVVVRVPWSIGSQDTSLSGVTLQMLDEAGNPARFGNRPITETFAMKPTFDIAEWEWRGSVPSAPGKYHARVQIEALYNKARNGTLYLGAPALDAVAESGPPLTSGYVFSEDSNIWLMSSDGARQRRLTYFPEFYEYADKPVWAPDGKRIAFTYSPQTDPSEAPSTEIWQVAPGGSAPEPLVRHQGSESLLDPAWSRDGKYIYFTVDTSASESATASGALSATSVRIDRVELATGVREQWMPLSQMPAGDGPGGETVYLQYVQPQGNAEELIALPQRLMLAKPNSETGSVVVDEKAFQMMYAPRMSPDGKWVAFAAINIPPVSIPSAPTTPTPTPKPLGDRLDILGWLGLGAQEADAHGLPWDLYMAPASGGAPIRLTKLDEDQPYPTWLDNSTIAFMGSKALYKLPIDASGNPVGEPVKIRDGAPHGGLSWHTP